MLDTGRFTRSLFSPLPARYDRLAETLSFAQNGRWRLAAVTEIAQGVSRDNPLILDVASGTAGVAIELARRTGATVVGVDLTEPMLRRGTANVAASEVAGRVRLVAAQAERLPFEDATFDALAFSYLLRYVADPQATLTELARVVRPGGVMASLEFCVPGRACMAPRVARVHPAGAAVGGADSRRARLVAGRPVPRAIHLRALPAISRGLDRAGVGEGRVRRRRHQADEPGRRPGHVGNPGPWLTRRDRMR